jgi:hypothetical protein
MFPRRHGSLASQKPRSMRGFDNCEPSLLRDLKRIVNLDAKVSVR